MSNFKFPPVPPPPPRATADPVSNDRGRNSRGRGRGRGSNNYRRRAFRDGGSFYVQQDDRSSSTDQHSNNAYSQNFATSQAHANVPNISYSPFTGFPVGSHVNPAFFRNNQLRQGSNHQSFNARNGDTGLYPPRTDAGQKRKLEALREPQQDRRKPGPPTAPSVPSFGAGILPSYQDNRASASQQIKKKQPRKRLTNTLGLTPTSLIPQYSSSEAEAEASGDDVDEEAMYAELGTTLTFEHNGTVMSLNTAADLNAWKKERRKAWPTRQRLAEKAEEKQRVGERRKRMIADAIAALSKPKSRKFGGKPVNDRDPVRKAVDPKAIEELHREPIDPSSRIDAGVDDHIDGSAMIEPHSDQPHETSDSDSGSDISSDSSSDVSSDSSSDEDGPPEALPSNRPAPQGTLPQICRFFAAGSCRDGESCYHQHVVRPQKAANKPQPSRQINAENGDRSEESSRRPDIYRVLVEKEEEGIDELGLQVIKFLGDFGFFDSK